jgi:hypothetical protein
MEPLEAPPVAAKREGRSNNPVEWKDTQEL